MAKRNRQPDKKQVLRIPKELISSQEFSRRKRAWQECYANARESEAYKRFLRMREAVKNGDMATVRRLRAEISEVRDKGDYNSKPPFPDPNLEMTYGRLGVKEYWEKKIQEAKGKGMEIKTVS